MSWQGIEGHDPVVERFRRILANGRLASTFLLVGPAGIGKHTFAVKLAQTLLCETIPESRMQPCGECPACQQVAAGTHPDLELVAKPADKSFLPIELFIGDREHRMRAGLCHNISLKPFRGGRKVAIIDDADYLNVEGANCLLKTLEEPPPQSVIMLIATSEQRQLPTIRSRCQVIRFQPLPRQVVASLLLEQSPADGNGALVADQKQAEQLAAISNGSLQRAMQLADEQLYEFRGSLLAQLASLPERSVSLAADIGSFVDSAGKEAPVRRERLKLVIDFAADFYRQLARRCQGLSANDDPVLSAAVDLALRSANLHIDTIAGRIERCLEAQSQG